MAPKRRIGIVGFGHLGKFLYESIRESADFDVAFVYNRSKNADLERLVEDEDLLLDALDDFASKAPDLIVEVAHPDVTKVHGEAFLSVCDYLIGSPTALADPDVEKALKKAPHAVFVPAGALWGGNDIRRMSQLGSLAALRVTMRKHPDAFKLQGQLKDVNDAYKARKDEDEAPIILYEGPVRGLCPLAPNNVNTMAAAAVAASNLGLDGVIGRLVADKRLERWHEVHVEAKGANGFEVNAVRKNPANPGAVTGSATYGSFWASVRQAALAENPRPGLQLC